MLSILAEVIMSFIGLVCSISVEVIFITTIASVVLSLSVVVNTVVVNVVVVEIPILSISFGIAVVSKRN